MTDQANNLRNLMLNRKNMDEAPIAKSSARVITVSSGKGGVGKSNFSVNLAIQLIKRGKRCVIIDADFGLANIEVLLGVMPKYSFANVISGEKPIIETVTEGPGGIKFISGGSGFTQLANISDRQISYLIENIAHLDDISDIILIDTGAGISKQVVDFITASNEAVIVTTPEPTSITDAYAIIKKIKEMGNIMPKFNIIVNRAESKKEGDEIFGKLERVCAKFLGIEVNNLGYLPYDQYLVKAVKAQQPVSIMYPNAPVVKNIERISEYIIDSHNKAPMAEDGLKGFVKRLLVAFR